VMKSDFLQVWVLLSGFFTFGQSRTFNVISARILWFKRDFSIIFFLLLSSLLLCVFLGKKEDKLYILNIFYIQKME
jgi:hypothetical protein